jgi:triacylglycerol esterase/lipase EstA (alpha/beta hydrolase family)
LLAGTRVAPSPAHAAGLADPAGYRVGPTTGPAFSVPESIRDEALSCPASFNHAHEPVLLVHALAQTPDEAWSWSYAKVLPAQGFDVCTVALPDLARGDIQVQTDYVAHAIMAMGRRSGTKVDVVGVSVPALAVRAAMKWWPDARDLVDDLVLVSAPNHGNVNLEVLCAVPCIAPFWQTKSGSTFLAALNAGDETPGDVAYTSIYSWTDPAIQPNLPGGGTSDLAGASNIAVQDLCLVRFVDHVGALSDAAVYAVVIDALTRPGPADPARIDRSVCLQVAMPGVDPLQAVATDVAWWRDITIRGLEHQVDREPPLAPWAVP